MVQAMVAVVAELRPMLVALVVVLAVLVLPVS
jgi:hypothetical protein